MDTQTRSDQPTRELTVETFAALTAGSAQSAGARYAVTVRRVAGPGSRFAGRPMRAVLENISRDGVSLITPEPLRGQFEMFVPGDGGNQLVITCAHASLQQMAAGQHQVAGTFRYFSMLPAHPTAAAA
jgi:hypothetical protein